LKRKQKLVPEGYANTNGVFEVAGGYECEERVVWEGQSE